MDDKRKLEKLIDKGIGTSGENLRIPSFWMREIFRNLMNWVEKFTQKSVDPLYPPDLNNDFNDDFAN